MEFGGVLRENSSLPSVVTVVKNVAVALGLTALCLFIFAVILTFTDFPQGLVPAVVLVMTILSVMLSGVLTAQGGRTKGWLNGAVSGVLYMVILYCLSSLAFGDLSFGLNTITMLAIGLFAGTFGGIVGINMRVKRR